MKAFTVSNDSKVYVYMTPINMCMQFNGLSELVVKKLRKKPSNGDLYLFVNKRYNYVKVLFYSNGGYCIFAKRLDGGTFDYDDVSNQMTVQELQRLVDSVTSEAIVVPSRGKQPEQVAAQ